MKKIKLKSSHWVIFIFLLIIPLVNFNHHRYNSKEGVISFDIKSYYAYLPATFIYHDLSLSFMDDDIQKYGYWIWPVKTPTGKKAILTTMGQSVMYSPFFCIAHIYALSSPKYEADGFSKPYHVAIQFSVFVYFILALFLLRKILLRYYSETVAAITLFAIGAGTNLFYYVGYEGPMTHGSNFFLIVVFIYLLEKWHREQSFKNSILLGALSGLIALIRPTNVAVLLLIPLWHVGSFKDLWASIQILLQNWLKVIIMAISFIIVWIPQFIYWKYVSGKFLFFSYGVRSDRFYWENPQIFKILFSYEKGWFVYTPLMLLAFVGIYFLVKKRLKLALPITIYLVVMVYVLSSWWSWWYGGAFGQRSMVDFYGLMAIPLAALIEYYYNLKWKRYIVLLVLSLLVAFNQFNIQQYRRMAISYWWMNKEGYWENFLKIRPTCKYWNVAMHPNYDKARLGLYEAEAPFSRGQEVTNDMLVERIVKENRNNNDLISLLSDKNKDNVDSLLNLYAKVIVDNKKAGDYYRMIKLDYYRKEIDHCKDWKKKIERMAKRREITYEEMRNLEAERIFVNYSKKYDK